MSRKTTMSPSKLIPRLTPPCLMRIPLAIFAISVIVLMPFSSAVTVQNADSPDATRGQQIFEHRCTGCHGFDNDKEGPRLHGVFGRKSGTVPTFKYSDAVKNAGVTWDESSLDKWLTDPDKFIADNDMDFHLEKANERADVIAFLKQSSGK